MERTRNEALAEWMAEHQMTEGELADAVNGELGALTGRDGLVSDRTVRRWLSGETRWPQTRQCKVLEQLAGRSAEALGFVPRRSRSRSAPPQEVEPVQRRVFLTATTGTALAATAVAGQGPRPRVGMSDVNRLAARLADVVASDDRHGGTTALETRAAALARQTLDLQQRGSSTTRVRSHLYALAAAFTSSAMWAATDGQRLDTAQQHMQRAVTLAGLSGDGAVRFRVWGHAAALYRQLGRYTDALAADDAARAVVITRRDPLYASLAHARIAVTHADLHARTAALRSLGHAQDALTRADRNTPRPPWMQFYDEAELELLTLITHTVLGQWADAEAHAHQHLALLRPELVRNRALSLAYLAHAQLEQGALEPAVASALAVPADARQGRAGQKLAQFTARLAAVAPRTPEARAWADHCHEGKTSVER
ncbi:Tat pathway signal protein [Streptomyces sp. NPDC046215]|uniref:Tat pathway signal protein n=1 Tax=Streptomyces TaxID=1883 RepID=UPI0031E3EFF0